MGMVPCSNDASKLKMQKRRFVVHRVHHKHLLEAQKLSAEPHGTHMVFVSRYISSFSYTITA